MVIFHLAVPSNPKEENTSNTKVKFKLSPNMLFLGAIWMIANGQLLSYTTFGSQFFQLYNMSTQEAAFLTSMIMLVPIFMTPIIGILIDKTGRKKQALFLGLVIMAVALFSIATNWLPLTLSVIALGLGFSFVPVVVFSLLPDVVKPEHTGIGLAVITASSSLGITIGPAGFGTILDLTLGNFTIGFLGLAILSIVGIVMLLGIKVRQ